MGTSLLEPFRILLKTLKNLNQNAQGSRTHQTHEAQHRAGRHRWQEGGQPCRMHQAIVGLHQEEQPPRPREQTILRARQEDGQGLRKRPHQGFRHGQVPLRTLVLSVLNCQSTHSWLDKPNLEVVGPFTHTQGDFGAIFNATSSTMFSDTKVPHPSLPFKTFLESDEFNCDYAAGSILIDCKTSLRTHFII